MEIPTEIMKYCQSCYKWDDDLRQDVYMKIMELPEGTEVNKAWCLTVYRHLWTNRNFIEGNRARLREENYDLIVNNLALDKAADDPADTAESEDTILKHLDSLSAALQDTMIQFYFEGRSAEEIAETNNENVEAVRKRITRARKQLKGDTNDRQSTTESIPQPTG